MAFTRDHTFFGEFFVEGAYHRIWQILWFGSNSEEIKVVVGNWKAKEDSDAGKAPLETTNHIIKIDKRREEKSINLLMTRIYEELQVTDFSDADLGMIG